MAVPEGPIVAKVRMAVAYQVMDQIQIVMLF